MGPTSNPPGEVKLRKKAKVLQGCCRVAMVVSAIDVLKRTHVFFLEAPFRYLGLVSGCLGFHGVQKHIISFE